VGSLVFELLAVSRASISSYEKPVGTSCVG
jgi:hypothetical protein